MHALCWLGHKRRREKKWIIFMTIFLSAAYIHFIHPKKSININILCVIFFSFFSNNRFKFHWLIRILFLDRCDIFMWTWIIFERFTRRFFKWSYSNGISKNWKIKTSITNLWCAWWISLSIKIILKSFSVDNLKTIDALQ